MALALSGCAPWQPLDGQPGTPSGTAANSAPETAVPSPNGTPGSTPDGTPGSTPDGTPGSTPGATPGATPYVPPADQAEPPQAGDRVISSKLARDWAWPGPDRPITVVHDNPIPVAPPPAPPLPYLYSIGVGAHPSENPSFDQMSFRFSGGFPGYELEYVPRLLGDASGLPIWMPGTNTVLRVVFHPAQAHLEDGRSSVVASPPAFVGYRAITRYAPAGDAEGYLSYGIGVGRPMKSTPRTPVRVYEVEKIEQGRHLYVVAIQIDARDWE